MGRCGVWGCGVVGGAKVCVVVCVVEELEQRRIRIDDIETPT